MPGSRMTGRPVARRASFCEKAKKLRTGAARRVTICALTSALVLVGAARAEDDPDARFTPDMWRPDLLLSLSAGPALLPAGLDLDLPAPPGPLGTQGELDRLELIYAPLRDERARHLIALEAEAGATELLWRYGLIPSKGEAPALWSVLDAAASEVTWFVLREKRTHARARPTQVRPGLGSVIPVPAHPSYPSGHAAQIIALTEILGRVVPDCSPTYRRIAAGVAIRREIAGVHFPSDTLAGAQLADRVVDQLLRDGRVIIPLGADTPLIRAHARTVGCAASPPDGTGGAP